MSENVFTPKLQSKSVAESEVEYGQRSDRMSAMLLQISRLVTVVFILLLPVFFVPGLWATLGFQKSLLALSGVVIVVTMMSLLMLRQARVRTILPMPLVCFLGFIAVAAVSAVFSDDPSGAFRGGVLETGTVAFFGLLAGVMALPLVLQQSKKSVMRTLQAIVVSTLLLLAYCVVRLFFGPIFAFDSFGAVTASPLGGFNDLAVFAGLSVMVALVALLQLPIRKTLQAILLFVTVLALIVLAVVNFFFVWVIIGFFGLLMLLYVVSCDSLFASVQGSQVAQTAPSYILIVTTALVCLVSVWFIVMGDVASGQVNRLFGVSYLEVRPSFSATADIAKSVYDDNLLLGTGPNQFTTGWREFKDQSINETIFWSTDFVAGSSYGTTIAVTTGVLGILMLLLFHIWYVWFGFRMLVMSRQQDKFWYFAGTVSFVGAVFLWLMTYLYVPGATILLLAAFFTGISFVAGAVLLPESVKVIPLVSNRQRGFGLMALAIILISGSVGALFTAGQQYLAHASFNQTQAVSTDAAAIDQAALLAYSQYPDDSFLGVRARIALLEMNQLMNVAEPSEAEQQKFVNVSSRGLAAANQAIAVAPQNPQHHTVLSAIYNNLAMTGVPDALARATSSLETAKNLDPKNPTYLLVEAQMAIRRGDVGAAKTALLAALQKKRNFTEALFLLAQVDIAQGNTEAAIDSTRAMITLEPNNPTRYYQLGILLTAAGDTVGAHAAYETALRIDPNYANARYFRALLLVNDSDIGTAVRELRLVQENNPENELLTSLITQLSSGATSTPSLANDFDVPVAEPAPQENEETITSPIVPDSYLLTPLNTVAGQTEVEENDVPESFTDPEAAQENSEELELNQELQ